MGSVNDEVEPPSEKIYDELTDLEYLRLDSPTVEDLAEEYHTRSAFVYDLLDRLVLDEEFDVDHRTARDSARNPDWRSEERYILENFDEEAAEYAKNKFSNKSRFQY